MAVPSACRKSLFDKLLQVFLNLKSSEKLMIENERHPSWVSFVTIFLPVAQDFRVYRQSESLPHGRLPFYPFLEGQIRLTPESSRYMPKGLRRTATSSVVDIQAPSKAAATAQGTALFRVGLSR